MSLNHSLPKPSTYLLLLLLIATYVVYFSWYTINRHNTLNSYAADLSLIDQPMWNTVRGPGGFMELTWGDRQQPRLAEHFEPILLPLSLLFFLWDDVRILLIAQSVALAVGALPVFWIAREQLVISNGQLTVNEASGNINQSSSRTSQSLISNLQSQSSPWIALAFALTYLLSPHLQAANIADFHADPFVVTPLLFAFWYATQRRWGWMWFWALIAMLTKETLPTLTAMLGLYLIIIFFQSKGTQAPPPPSKIDHSSFIVHRSTLTHGLLLILISTGWFLIATFVIVAPLARSYFGTEGPIYFANRYSGGLAGLPELLLDPARWRYVFGLFAAVGFLPLLAPELLLLGLPVLAANLLSNFPGQYSGEQHYSAPLVAALIIAAIYGARRIVNSTSLREVNGQALKRSALIGVTLWLLSWSFGYHATHGWTPLSTRTETYRPSPATALLPELITQIPAAAKVSASAGIHPHLAHRRVIYVFPIVEDAEFLLVDVTDIPGTHPNDARAQIIEMLNRDWQLRQADQGLILAEKSSAGPATNQLPPSFFDFARGTAAPAYRTKLTFGENDLRLLGYDVKDDPDDGVIFRFHWQAQDTLPDDLQLWPLVYDDLGRLLNDPTQVPMIAAVWYPPAVWQPGEVIVTETLPRPLPDSFHLGLAVGPEGRFGDPTRRFVAVEPGAEAKSRPQPGGWVQLATFQRQGPFLHPFEPTPSLLALSAANSSFGSALRLTGYWFDDTRLQAGQMLPVRLQWMANEPPPTDYTVFVHLLAADGSLMAQADAMPTWLTPSPTSQWPLDQPVPDSHFLALPEELPPGTYTLQIGLYQADTLERLLMPDGRDALVLGQVEVR